MEPADNVRQLPFLVGLGYRKQSGKDTLAAYMQKALEDRGITTVTYALASPLKRLVCSVYGVPEAHAFGGDEEKEELSRVLDARGSRHTVRTLLQDFGCDMRDAFPGIWAEALLYREWAEEPGGDPPAVGIVTDVRFADEADIIKSQGGLLIRVDRPRSPTDTHRSEGQLGTYPWDMVVQNAEGLYELRCNANRLATLVASRL